MSRQPHAVPERRHDAAPIPAELDQILTSAQRRTLAQVESFGWRLTCVRHPLLQPPTVIVERPEDGAYATITESGELEFDPELRIRH